MLFGTEGEQKGRCCGGGRGRPDGAREDAGILACGLGALLVEGCGDGGCECFRDDGKFV